MKPLTSDTLAKAAIIEGYCWEISALEVANKNTEGARYFMELADSLHAMYEMGHDDEKAPGPPGMAGLGRIPESLRRAIQRMEEPTTGPPVMPETGEAPSGSWRPG